MTRKPFQFGLRNLFGVLTLTACIAWVASLYSQFAAWLIGAIWLVILLATMMTIAVSLEAALGPARNEPEETVP